MEKTLLSVVGPTAIGKTAMAISLAGYFDTEIISSDSRQFYKEMHIGTAVPSAEELAMAKHHFIQHKRILGAYSVGDFERDALQLLEKLFGEKDVVVMVGGSGLYNDAVTKGLDKFPKIDPDIRKHLNKVYSENGIQNLQEQLKSEDPFYYDKVDIENPHRLIRALEVCFGTGKPYSSFLEKAKKSRPFRTITIGLKADRQLVYDRIDTRVDDMIAQGLVSEAQKLKKFQNLNALQTVGYQELFNHFEGNWTLDFAISEIKKNTRRFAKRQMTWFRKNKDTIWVPHDIGTDALVSAVENKFFTMEKNKHIFFVMGVSGSGKTTIGKLLAKKLGIAFFDGDSYHPEANVQKMAQGHPLNDDDRKGWLERLNELAQEHENQGAVIACSALKGKYRKLLRQGIEKIDFVYLEGSFDLISKRLTDRKGHFMPPELLRSQFEALEIPNHAISVSIDATPSEIVSDIMVQLKPNQNG
ncbi:tRNA (adenosine(37)-N6)-dimethylallyltransferase MiaA [Pricia sp.]|uniref:tRNA (adenosine(37)-N6)-dimethylallyltransferase MiaA n=1 Tax=Pricia sp. TaxID=2268138 RepID=UPI0035945F9C